MMRLVGVELFKFRTQRAHVVILVLGLALTVLGLGLLFVATLVDPGEGAQLSLEAPDMQRRLLTSTGTSFVVLLLAILGITAEFRHGTISSTVRGVPQRHNIVIAKAITYALIALAYGIVAAILNQVGARLILGLEGVEVAVSTGDLISDVGKGFVALALFAVLGVGIAAVVANQVAAIVIVVVEPFVSSIVAAFLPAVGKYLPSRAIEAFTRPDQGFVETLEPLAGLVVFLLYVSAAVAGGIVMLSRRDIT